MKTRIRTLTALSLAAALLPFGVTSAFAAATAEKVIVENPAKATPIDWAINALVARKTERLKLSPADARIAREQMQLQFRSLSSERQKEIVSSAARLTGEEGLLRVEQLMKEAVRSNAEQAFAEMRASAAKSTAEAVRIEAVGAQPGPALGPSGPDLVFVATAGPCRVYDSRFGPGIFAPFESRQVYVYSTVAGWSWASAGGTGTSNTGNCVGTEFFGAPPLNVIATVTILNTNTTGALRAWNGGTTLVTGAVHAWNPGQITSNTTVIPADRVIVPYPSTGFKKDIGINNNSGGNVDVIIDVVGYFRPNTATALDCTQVSDTPFSLGAFSSTLAIAPACPAGYTEMASLPSTNVYGVYTGSLLRGSCRLNNTTGAVVNNLTCSAFCCRVPGN